jgi:hydrogenase expression/formation protein HypD
VRSADPFQDPRRVAALSGRIDALAARLGRPATFMEVCGTHTHAIAAAGLRRLLPPQVRLISGPGCPVCVTPVDDLDRALGLARLPDLSLCTFGDLLRVPASRRDSLERVRAEGADVQIVYSPRDAVQIARERPGRRVVLVGIGFETTMPTVAAALDEAERTGVSNFFVLPCGKLVEPPLRALAADPEVAVDGFLLPGHVSVILGWRAYQFLVDEFGLGGVVVGFGAVDIQAGIEALLRQLVEGRPRIENRYTRVVGPDGNRAALELIERFFEPVTTRWRGLGAIPGSGLALRPAWAHRDASRFPLVLPEPEEPRGCRCGEVLRGRIEPPACPLFARACRPDHPVGACMVSSEGTCAAWYRHEEWPQEVGR